MADFFNGELGVTGEFLERVGEDAGRLLVTTAGMEVDLSVGSFWLCLGGESAASLSELTATFFAGGLGDASLCTENLGDVSLTENLGDVSLTENLGEDGSAVTIEMRALGDTVRAEAVGDRCSLVLLSMLALRPTEGDRLVRTGLIRCFDCGDFGLLTLTGSVGASVTFGDRRGEVLCGDRLEVRTECTGEWLDDRMAQRSVKNEE